MNANHSKLPRRAAMFSAIALLSPSTLVAQNYTRNFPVKWTYFQHTIGDRNALNADPATKWGVNGDGSYMTGGIEADTSMYTRLLGSGKVISGLNAGDYILIKASGNARLDGGASTTYESAGVFVDRSTIRARTGYQNRFQGVANTLRVDSLMGSGDFGGRSGSWSGEQPAAQDTPDDFSLGMSNGPGVIVKVPSATNLCFFHTVNHTRFSSIERDGATLSFTKLDPSSGRPRFHFTDYLVSESWGTVQIPIRRQNALDHSCRVRYTINVGGREADFENVVTGNLSGTIDFPAGSQVGYTNPISIKQDSIYEGNENFSIRIYIDPADNPNEAYVESNGITDMTYTISIVDDDPVPNVYFSSPASSDQSGFASSSGIEPVNSGSAEQLVYVPVSLDRPSAFDTAVWYSYTLADVGSGGVVAGVAAVDGSDFVFNNLPENRYIIIPAGSTSGNLPIYLRGDALYESTEKIALHLGVDGSRGATNPGWKPATNKGNGNVGMSGRHILLITDQDSAPTVSFSLVATGDANRPEPDNGTGNQTRQARVTLSGSSANAITVPLQYTGTAARGSDFTAPDSVQIPAGASTVTFNVVVLDDTLTEFDEIILIGIGSGAQGLLPGNPSTISIAIGDNDGGDHSNQLAPRPELPRPIANCGIAMSIDSPMSVAVWRIRGEPLWRMADDPATPSVVEGMAMGLAPGFHEIEFRGFEGYISPSPMMVEVAAGQIWTPTNGEKPYYIALESDSPGTSLTVTTTGLANPADGGWKLEGETTWRASGSSFTGFPKGTYRVFYKPVTGYLLPKEHLLSFGTTLVRNVSRGYVADPNPSQNGWPPGGLGNQFIADDSDFSTLFIGRISSSAGFGTGTAAQVNTVLTCAHILFDDATLSFATNVRWHHQAQRDFHQPAAELESEYTGVLNAAGARVHSSGIVPRGWVVMGDYAAKRIEHMETGGSPGYATPESQNLDVGALFFTKPVARGAKIGLAIRRDNETTGRWLQAAQGDTAAPVSKRLLGYPYDNVPADDIGKVFRRTYSVGKNNYQSFTVVHAQDHVFNSYNIVAGAGMSGAPVLLESSPGVWRQCAVYLGANLGSNFGVMRELGEDVADLVTEAQGLADPNNDTTGGNQSQGSSLAGVNLNKGRVYFKANVAGASWKVSGTLTSRSCGFGSARGEYLDVTPGVYTPVVFGLVPNWKSPSILPVITTAGTEIEHQIQYLPLNYAAIANLLSANGADSASRGPGADFDQDGVLNLLEWAFNLDPLSHDARTLVPATGTRGLPHVSLAGAGTTRRLKIEFVRLRSSSVPNVQYIPEFASEPGVSTWSGGGNVISTTTIDANWERVIVEDAITGSSRRFARVRVVSN